MPQIQPQKKQGPLVATYKVAWWGENYKEVFSKMFDKKEDAEEFLKGKNGLLFENQKAEGPEYTWIVVPVGDTFFAYQSASFIYKYRWWILGLIVIVVAFFVYKNFKHKLFGDGGSVPAAAPAPIAAPAPVPAPAPVNPV